MSRVPKLKPKKVIASLEKYEQSLSEDVEAWKSIYNAVVESLGPDCPHKPFTEDDVGLLNGIGSEPESEKQAAPSDDLLEVIPSGSGDVINLDTSSDDEPSKDEALESKENVLLESLSLKSLITHMKQEKGEDQKNLLHYLVMENLPLKITDKDLERDVFNLVDIDRKSLALNIVRKTTESVVQIYTNDMRQVEKILAIDKKLVVGGRVLTTHISTGGRH